MSSGPGGPAPPARALGSEQDPADATFEEVLSRLQGVVDKLEGGELSLEDALAVFEQGVTLSRVGAQKLDEAERRIEVLLGGEGSETRPLDLDGGPSSSAPTRSVQPPGPSRVPPARTPDAAKGDE